MKLLFIILTILINSILAIDYATIIPYGKSQCNNMPSGTGYYVPLDTCIKIYFQDTYFKVIGNQIFVIIGENCTDHNAQVYINDLNECGDFKLPNSRNHYSSIITLNTTPPSNVINFNYYFNSKSCSNNYFSIFHTDGSSQDFYKYVCDSGEPIIYDCYQLTSQYCQPINISKGCDTSYGYPNNISC